MRLVGDDDDVVAVRKQRKRIFVLARHELLDRGEHDAAGRALAQQRAQLLPCHALHRPFPEQVLRQ